MGELGGLVCLGVLGSFQVNEGDELRWFWRNAIQLRCRGYSYSCDRKIQHNEGNISITVSQCNKC